MHLPHFLRRVVSVQGRTAPLSSCGELFAPAVLPSRIDALQVNFHTSPKSVAFRQSSGLPSNSRPNPGAPSFERLSAIRSCSGVLTQGALESPCEAAGGTAVLPTVLCGEPDGNAQCASTISQIFRLRARSPTFLQVANRILHRSEEMSFVTYEECALEQRNLSRPYVGPHGSLSTPGRLLLNIW
ncbi:hypothetical protein BC834DRAFT_35844 [Gloeopeniophorella convolvens]|nr:hypothetical protein BC834DRAFT_35844 [Gloeopeniophorella convolvens]